VLFFKKYFKNNINMSFVSPYKDIINNNIDKHLSEYFSNDTNLKNIVMYSLNNGQRIRPSISIDIYNSLTGNENIGYTALSIEYIHTASLIIDDLPCMDNALLRRNQECVHKHYGEAIAQIVSVLLMSLGMDTISKSTCNLLESQINKIGVFFLQNFSSTITRASDGQLLDLATVNDSIGNILKKVSSEIDTTEIIRKKTGSFFETSFLIGWLYGGGDFNKVDTIKKIADIFGMIYQIIDDIYDQEEDLLTNKKNTTQNYAIRHGVDKAIQDTKDFINEFKIEMNNIKMFSTFFQNIISFLEHKLLFHKTTFQKS